MEWKADWGLRARMVLTMALLFVVYLAFAGALAWYFGASLLVFALLMGGLSLGQYFFSDKLTLWSMGAREVSEDEYPHLHGVVGRLSQQADLPKPTVAVVDSRVPNAFATGRSKNHAAVCVTTGLLDALNDEEVEGVLAHELAHVKHRDMAVMTVASFLSTIAFIIVRWGWFLGGSRDRNQAPIWVAIVVSLVVWIVSYLLIRALSRYREFAADRGAALITGNPAALASALLKIDGRMDRVPTEDLREQAEMNAFFIIPLTGGTITRLFSTHPATEKRVERLRGMEKEMETTSTA
ncbi:zinc metalloprotease HtpX [Halarchaeum sp. CBA1220]|uniref:Protease HtpX homolog n=1 Tax=Halarchaeum grantii TaxID=1193105 RepID=A0A830EU24_9EURY|nr:MULTISPECIES: zinc metalloprotease HtpX [Halarchaeum]QLC33335.1 zinc metalloprotease HtpX [Halarchaeum sp. CBA1220]GGL29675.1 heat-shock protein HtpX [Halarchaeum grantii]